MVSPELEPSRKVQPFVERDMTLRDLGFALAAIGLVCAVVVGTTWGL